jgi:hypothetical protein
MKRMFMGNHEPGKRLFLHGSGFAAGRREWVSRPAPERLTAELKLRASPGAARIHCCGEPKEGYALCRTNS